MSIGVTHSLGSTEGSIALLSRKQLWYGTSSTYGTIQPTADAQLLAFSATIKATHEASTRRVHHHSDNEDRSKQTQQVAITT